MQWSPAGEALSACGTVAWRLSARDAHPKIAESQATQVAGPEVYGRATGDEGPERRDTPDAAHREPVAPRRQRQQQTDGHHRTRHENAQRKQAPTRPGPKPTAR